MVYLIAVKLSKGLEHLWVGGEVEGSRRKRPFYTLGVCVIEKA